MQTRAHVHEEVFPVPAEQLFALLHTPSAICSWWSAERAIVMPETGGTWAATWGVDEDDPDYVTVATIREFDPPRRLVLGDYRYRARGGPLPFETEFETSFEVTPHDDGAVLRVTQAGFPATPESDGFYAACQQGWSDTFAGIREHIARLDDDGMPHGVVMQTDALDLRGLEARHWLALMDGEAAFAEAFGLAAAPGLREHVTSDDVSPEWLAMLREAAPGVDPWAFGFAVVERASQQVVGTVGFTGAPGEDGVVELAYAIVPGSQGRGFATQAAAAGVVWALEDPIVEVVQAHTLPEVSASTTVLERNGFRKVDEVVHDDDGPVWRWELARGDA